ncbi:MAG: N-acetylmuramoyl-L-alanine amidase [Lachnospiraceae bacterium]|nr:N-acetylmuramoyl-L-alanine amidase [Lachnospiraceae bacterium]
MKKQNASNKEGTYIVTLVLAALLLLFMVAFLVRLASDPDRKPGRVTEEASDTEGTRSAQVGTTAPADRSTEDIADNKTTVDPPDISSPSGQAEPSTDPQPTERREYVMVPYTTAAAWEGVPDMNTITGTAIPVQGGIRIPSWITQDLIRVSEVNRPGMQLDAMNAVVVHYAASAGGGATGVRDFFYNQPYFRALGDRENSPGTSAQFIVGLFGEILQTVPINEVAYANRYRNHDTINVETCHPDETGVFTDASYQSLVKLCAWLLEVHGLEVTDTTLIRHYDVWEKPCPLNFVNDPQAWADFKENVRIYMLQHPDIASEMP